MIYIKDLENFNSQIKYYKNMLKYIENNKNPTILRKKMSDDMLMSLRSSIQFLTNNINLLSLYITRFEEKSRNTEQINEFLSKLPSVENIELIDKRFDKKKQIRNCLAHADFKICIDDSKCTEIKSMNGIYVPYFSEDPLYLEIDNGIIRGKFTYTDLANIAVKYYEIASAENKLYNLFLIPKDLNIKNSNNIDKILSKFEKVKIKMFSNPSLSKIDTLNLFYTFSTYLETNLGMSSIDTKQILEYMFNIYRLSGENDYQMIKVKFSDENKEMIKKYIKFIGVGVWDNKLDYQSKVRLISDIISLESGNYCNTMNSVNYSNLLGGLYDNYTDDKIDKILTDLMFQTPFLYYDMLLSYTNYCLGYAREVNQNSANNKFFEFKYINLDGINPFFSSSKEKKEKIVNVFDENLFYQKQYEEENLYNNLKLISTKMKLLNTNNRTPNKSKIINSINQKIENIDVDYVLSVVSNRIEIEDISLNLSKDEILLILNELMEEHDNLSEQQSKVYNRFSETLSKYCKKGNKSYPISDLSLKLQNIDRELTEKN